MRNAFALALLLGCAESSTPSADTAAPADDTASADAAVEPDVAPEPEGSYYDFIVAFGTSKLQQRYKGILAPEKVSFGCTHIGPAKSLAIEFTYPDPYATINLNFGFVRGSDVHDITIETEGSFPWGKGAVNAPPSFKLVATDGAGSPQLTLGSWVDTAEGTLHIDRWGKTGGEVVEGRIEGTVVNDGAFPADAVIQGSFRVELPPEEGCGGT